jgi:hypothetical protein
VAGIEIAKGEVNANIGFRKDELTRLAYPGKFKTYG